MHLDENLICTCWLCCSEQVMRCIVFYKEMHNYAMNFQQGIVTPRAVFFWCLKFLDHFNIVYLASLHVLCHQEVDKVYSTRKEIYMWPFTSKWGISRQKDILSGVHQEKELNFLFIMILFIIFVAHAKPELQHFMCWNMVCVKKLILNNRASKNWEKN